jgi:hypothetical protein
VAARPVSYVPPYMRGAGGAAVAGASGTFSLARDPNDRPGKISSGAATGAPRLCWGALAARRAALGLAAPAALPRRGGEGRP